MVYITHKFQIDLHVNIDGGTDVWFGKDKPDTMTPPTQFMKEITLENINRVFKKAKINCITDIVVNTVKDKYALEAVKSKGLHSITIETTTVTEEKYIKDNYETILLEIKKPRKCALIVKESNTLLFLVGRAHPYQQYILQDIDEEQYIDIQFLNQYFLYWTIGKQLELNFPEVFNFLEHPEKDNHLIGATKVLKSFNFI